MTYTETQLEAIRLLGRKDLEFGCLLNVKIWVSNGIDDKKLSRFFSTVIVDSENINGTVIYKTRHPLYSFSETSAKYRQEQGELEILGHIPHLEDLFRVAEDKGVMINLSRDSNNGFELFVGMKHFPYNITLQFIDQPTLSDILNLFK